MRDIKFRGKRIDNGEWVYGSLIGSDVIVGDIIDFTEEYFNCEYWWRVKPETVGQYTGLKDNNSKEIYEGDIVRYTFDNPDSVLATENGLKVRTDKIFWQEWRASFAIGCELTNNDLFRYVRNGNRVEVIGNIHDNPELLD